MCKSYSAMLSSSDTGTDIDIDTDTDTFATMYTPSLSQYCHSRHGYEYVYENQDSN